MGYEQPVLKGLGHMALMTMITDLNRKVNPTEVIPGVVFLGKITPEITSGVKTDARQMLKAGQKLIGVTDSQLSDATKSYNKSGDKELFFQNLNDLMTINSAGTSLLLAINDYALSPRASNTIEKSIATMEKIHQERVNLNSHGFPLAANEMALKGAIRLRLPEFTLNRRSDCVSIS